MSRSATNVIMIVPFITIIIGMREHLAKVNIVLLSSLIPVTLGIISCIIVNCFSSFRKFKINKFEEIKDSSNI